MAASDLRVSIEQPRLRCILDQALVLGHAQGPQLARQLARVLETWLTRSFWQVLDASELLPHARSEPGPMAPQPTIHPSALQAWLQLRDGVDAGSWVHRWAGDNLAESQLRGVGEENLLERFEWLAQGLLMRQQALAPASTQAARAAPWRGWCARWDGLAGAQDALALSATLDGALILCWPEPAQLPWPVQACQHLGLPVQQLTALQLTESPSTESQSAEPAPRSLMAEERQLLRQALVAAGLACRLQGLPPLAVVHVQLPLAPALIPAPLTAPIPTPPEAPDSDWSDPVPTHAPERAWQQAQVWWYVL